MFVKTSFGGATVIVQHDGQELYVETAASLGIPADRWVQINAVVTASVKVWRRRFGAKTSPRALGESLHRVVALAMNGRLDRNGEPDALTGADKAAIRRVCEAHGFSAPEELSPRAGRRRHRR